MARRNGRPSAGANNRSSERSSRGKRNGQRSGSSDSAEQPQGRRAATTSRKLAIDVVWSAIKDIEGDVLLAGHYLGVLPQAAELEIDRLVSGSEDRSTGKLMITELTRRGAIRGDLGEVLLFPVPDGRVAALGGMGRLGTFRAAQARVLARAVADVIGLLPGRDTLATVLIGSGKGNLKVKEAVAAFLEGVVEALESDRELRLDRIKFVEIQMDRALEILLAVRETAERLNEQRDRGGRVKLSPDRALGKGKGGIIPPDFGCSMMLAALAKASGQPGTTELAGALESVLGELPEAVRETVRARLRELHKTESASEALALSDVAMKFRLREPDTENGRAEVPTRVAFWTSGTHIHAAAITHTATITERAVPGRLPLVVNGAERLQNPDPKDIARRAASLCRLLVPPELKEVLGRMDPLVLEVDRTLAAMQWEALPGARNGKPLGVARPVARQLRTFYSPQPFHTELRQGLRALVIGDPAGRGLEIKAAREEAGAVAKILTKCGVQTELRIGAPEEGTGAGDGTTPAADYFEIVDLLLSGEFDIVHYSGHAAADPTNADRVGWVFKAGMLTAYDIEGMERPPRLVVANACLSAQVSPPNGGAGASVTPTGRRDAALVASLADEFFKQGVSDYIGAAWEIPSEPAKIFAEEFYRCLLEDGFTIGKSLMEVRGKLYESRAEVDTAWAAYQHYGDPTRSLRATPEGEP